MCKCRAILCILDLKIPRFWYLWGVLEPIPWDSQGPLHMRKGNASSISLAPSENAPE